MSMQNQSSRSYATATSDATGDDVVCYELMKSIARSKRTPIISKHVMALLITPTPDMTATWCPHAAIVRELQRLPRGEMPVKPVVSSNRDLLIWVKRNEPYGARIDMRSGLLYLEHMALLAIARTTKEAIDAGKFPGTKALAQARRDSQMFPEYVKCPKSGHRTAEKTGAEPMVPTSEIMEDMRDDLMAITRDRKRYDDLTRSEAGRHLNKARLDHTTFRFLTSQASARIPEHADANIDGFLNDLERHMTLGITPFTVMTPGEFKLEIALHPEIGDTDLTPLRRALKYGDLDTCLRWLKDKTPQRVSASDEPRQSMNRHMHKRTPEELAASSRAKHALSQFHWPEESGLRSVVYETVYRYFAGDEGKPGTPKRYVTVSDIYPRIRTSQDGMSKTDVAIITTRVPSIPRVALSLTEYNIRADYVEHFLSTSHLFSRMTGKRFRYLPSSLQVLADEIRIVKEQEQAMKGSVDNHPEIV